MMQEVIGKNENLYLFFKKIFDNIPSGIIILDEHRNIVECNKTAEIICNFSFEEKPEISVYDIFNHDNEFFYFLNSESDFYKLNDFELNIKLDDGSEKTLLINASGLEEEPLEHIIINFSDITEIKVLQKELELKNEYLENLSMIDGLTELYNHITVLEFLSNEIERIKRYGGVLSVGMFDIDFFKKVNDNHGHKVGDNVLKETSRILKNQLRSSDILGRYGGEEFLIIFSDTNLKGALEVAERIRKKIESANMDGIKITISGGIAEYNKNTVEEIVKIADENLYRAKQTGRNKIIY